MNKINFDIPGGFPFDTGTLKRMQESIELLQSFSEIINGRTHLTDTSNKFTIIKGCYSAGQQVLDGVVSWKGEVLPFKGGIAQTTVILVEESESVEFENTIINDVYHNRYVTFGTGPDAILWSEFKRPSRIVDIDADLSKHSKLLSPYNRVVGAVMFWPDSLNSIPDGWEPTTDGGDRCPYIIKPGITGQYIEYNG